MIEDHSSRQISKYNIGQRVETYGGAQFTVLGVQWDLEGFPYYLAGDVKESPDAKSIFQGAHVPQGFIIKVIKK